MRIWHRLKILVPLLLTLTPSAESVAQPPAGFPSYGQPAFLTGAPTAYGPTAYQGMPDGVQSHPYISPFDNALEQHFNTDGLWFRRGFGGFGPEADIWRYSFNVDFTRTKTRELQGLIGNRDAATRLLHTKPRPDAIFCANDIMAMGVLDTLRHAHGLSVPDDMAVVGFDDVPMAGWPSFDLTTVRQRRNRMIEVTLDLLDDLRGDAEAPPVHRLIPGRLILRSSTRSP